LLGDSLSVFDDLKFASTVIANPEITFANIIQLVCATAVQPLVEEDVYNEVQIVY
jgi:hypothetical protein